MTLTRSMTLPSAQGRIFWGHGSNFQVGPICFKDGQGQGHIQAKGQIQGQGQIKVKVKVIQGQIFQIQGSTVHAC